MAESYKYQQNDYDGASVGYVQYNISPDFGRPVAPGEKIVVTGRAWHKRYAHKSIEFGLSVGGATLLMVVNKSIPKGKLTKFSFTYTVPAEAAEAIGSARTANAGMRFALYRGADGTGTGDLMRTVAAQQVCLLKYRLKPVFTAAKFLRCRQAEDESWEAYDEGTSILIQRLQLSISAAASAADVTICRLEYEDEEGEAHAFDLSATALLAGYAESAPGLLAGAGFLLGRDYRLTLTAGDSYDTATAQVVVPRAFANFHQAGAETGGAAFGMFSGSLDGSPMLESAYPFYGYGGIYGADGVQLDRTSEYSVNALTAQFEVYSEARRPMLTRIGKLVQLNGACKPVSAISGDDTEHTMFTIPREYWPTSEIYQVCQGSTTCVWMLHVSPSGIVSFARYRNGSSYSQAPAGAWLTFHAMWMASDYTGPVIVQRPAKAMKSNSSRGCVASASSVYGSSYPAWRAFDFKATTGWASKSDDGSAWLQLGMDVAMKNIEVKVYARDTKYIENPTAGAILGSNDGSTWTELGSFSGWSATQSGGLLGVVKCRHDTAYRYVRLSVTSRSRASHYVAVGYMVVRGELPE